MIIIDLTPPYLPEIISNPHYDMISIRRYLTPEEVTRGDPTIKYDPAGQPYIEYGNAP